MVYSKRLTILCGHYGTGKTNVAVNLAMAFQRQGESVTVADLDIVNPYFRTMDSADTLRDAGVRLLASPFANSNVDIPALPADLYSITNPNGGRMVLDIGGDDSGAMVLGRLSPAILEENNYEMWLVLNQFRPLTRDVSSTIEVMEEIQQASGLPFTGVVNNSNLGEETTPAHILSTVDYAEQVAKEAGVPLVMTTADSRLVDALQGQIPNLFPLDLQKNKPF